MVETSARLLRLLSLLQARPEWPGADLADRLQVTVRTLRRDVQKLRGLGYPVHAAPGVAGGYRLGAGAALPPLLLDDDEAVAVALSLRTAATHSVTGVGEASVRALAKLEQVLPPRLRERAIAVGHATVPLTGPGATVDADVLTAIARACRGREQIVFSPTNAVNATAVNDTIVNGNIGLRAGFGALGDVYAGYSRPLTGDVWYKNMWRIELRWRY